jgi:hypothetical protein
MKCTFHVETINLLIGASGFRTEGGLYIHSREVIFVCEKDVSPAIVSACEFTDAMHLTKAADIIRKQILQSKVTGEPRCCNLFWYKVQRSLSLKTAPLGLCLCVSTICVTSSTKTKLHRPNLRGKQLALQQGKWSRS